MSETYGNLLSQGGKKKKNKQKAKWLDWFGGSVDAKMSR